MGSNWTVVNQPGNAAVYLKGREHYASTPEY